MKYPMVCYECRTNLVCRCFKQPRTEWHSREEAAGSAAFHGWEAIGGLSYCPKCKLKEATLPPVGEEMIEWLKK